MRGMSMKYFFLVGSFNVTSFFFSKILMKSISKKWAHYAIIQTCVLLISSYNAEAQLRQDDISKMHEN